MATDLVPQELSDIPDTVPGGSDKSYRRGHWAWTEQQKLRSWNPLANNASWMSYEVQEALAAIEEPHQRKKRVTVLRLAEAKSLGLPIGTVFESSDTCGTVTWYGRSKEDPGWKDDPAIKNALEVAIARAQRYQDQVEAQRFELRSRQIELTKDELVDLTKLATQTLADLMMNAGSEKVRLEAAETILDRADEATARKLVSSTDISVSDRKGPSMADIRRRQRKRGVNGDGDDEEMGDEITVDADMVTAVTKEAILSNNNTSMSDVPDFESVEWVAADDSD